MSELSYVDENGTSNDLDIPPGVLELLEAVAFLEHKGIEEVAVDALQFYADSLSSNDVIRTLIVCRQEYANRQAPVPLGFLSIPQQEGSGAPS